MSKDPNRNAEYDAEFDEALRQTLAGQMGELRRELRKLLNAIAGETPFRQIGSFLRRGA